jgi:hypothetical protein
MQHFRISATCLISSQCRNEGMSVVAYVVRKCEPCRCPSKYLGRTEVSDALREQIDVLLDRAAERILKTPTAGTAYWHAMWQNRGSSDGQMHLRRHLLIRIAVAGHLGLDAAHDVRAALAAGANHEGREGRRSDLEAILAHAISPAEPVR